MKLVILTVDHVYANKIVKDVISNFGKDVELIVESSTLLPKKTKPEALKRYLAVSGFYYVITQIVKLELYKLLSLLTTLFSLKDSKFYPYSKLSPKYKIKLTSVGNVNDKKFILKIKKIKPDLLVSIFFNQIISSEVIKISKKGIINIHPAFLPDYKGVSPVFWTLANAEKYTGITTHYINEGIDTGTIIRRKKIKITKKDTEDTLYMRLCTLGAPLLVETINDIELGNVKTYQNSGGRYFSLPTKDAVKKFRLKKRRFLNLNEYLFQN